MTYNQARIKFKIEYLIIYPIVLVGKFVGYFYKPKSQPTHFLFFSSADIGGSVKVNAEITKCISMCNPLIIFSKKPKNNKFISLFEIENVSKIDISNWIDNKYYHFMNIFFRGMISTWINNSNSPVVFGGECIFFYKIIPHVKKKCKIVELCHMNTWFNYSQAFITRIDARIFSTMKIMRDLKEQYKKNNINPQFYERLFFVDNKIDIKPLRKHKNDKFQILFVGRGAPQKRVHLLVRIALLSNQFQLPVHFNFVGDVETYFDDESKKICNLLGPINDRAILEEIYDQNDALILTSAYEGLPLVVMDMMARGKIIISTAVDSIPDYIQHMHNGLLIENRSDSMIINDAIEIIKLIINDELLQEKLSKNAHLFASSHFASEVFDDFYKKILVGH